MNPGSSQFASQFPDAEETMSKMESKKLQAFVRDSGDIASVGFPTLGADAREIRETIRIAHEMLPIIKALVAAIHDECTEDGGYLLPTLKALDAAAPYIQD